MAILRIKPNMIEPLPGDKVPEIVDARGGRATLYDRLQNIDAQTIRGYVPVNKQGDTVDGTLILNGGAVIPQDVNLVIDGGMAFNGPISMVGSTDTDGTYGVSTVVANTCEFPLNVAEPLIVANFQPVTAGNFLIYIYFRIASATTGLTVNLTYEDGGGIKHQTIINNEYYDSGSYSLPPIFINALISTPINISATAQIPNQIFISTSIIGL